MGQGGGGRVEARGALVAAAARPWSATVLRAWSESLGRSKAFEQCPSRRAAEPVEALARWWRRRRGRGRLLCPRVERDASGCGLELWIEGLLPEASREWDLAARCGVRGAEADARSLGRVKAFEQRRPRKVCSAGVAYSVTVNPL